LQSHVDRTVVIIIVTAHDVMHHIIFPIHRLPSASRSQKSNALLRF